MPVGVPSYFGHLLIPTTQLTTGNVYTVNDLVANNQAPLIPPGSMWLTKDSGGNTVQYQYVKLLSSSPGNWAPGSPMYYRDYTRTAVSDYANDAPTFVNATATVVASFAGVILNQNAVNGNNTTNDSYIVIQKNGIIPFTWGGNGVAGNANSGNLNAIGAGVWGLLVNNNANNGMQDQWLMANNSMGPIGVANNSVPLQPYIITVSATQAFLVGPII